MIGGINIDNEHNGPFKNQLRNCSEQKVSKTISVLPRAKDKKHLKYFGEKS